METNEKPPDIQSEISELDRLLTEHGITTGLFAFGHERLTALLRGLAAGRDAVLEEIAKMLEIDAVDSSIASGIVKQVAANKVRSLKAKP